MSEDARNMAAELIQKKYGKLLRKVAYGVLNDWQLVEDVEQDVLWNLLLRHADKEELAPDQLKNYFCTAARNMAINYANKENLITQAEAEACSLASLSMDYIDMESFHDRYGFGPEMQELLSMLDNLDRDIICLKYGEGYSNAEIADFLSRQEDFVKKRVYRAKVKLQSILVDRKGGGEDE